MSQQYCRGRVEESIKLYPDDYIIPGVSGRGEGIKSGGPENPLSLSPGRSVLFISEDPGTERLEFGVTAIASYKFKGDNSSSCVDYIINARCRDKRNPYASNGEVTLTLRCMNNPDGVRDLLLLRVEDSSLAGDVRRQAGRDKVWVRTPEGSRQYEPYKTPAAMEADVTILKTAQSPRTARVQVWTYVRKDWIPAAGQRPVNQYLILERWPEGPWLLSGYSLVKESLRIAPED